MLHIAQDAGGHGKLMIGGAGNGRLARLLGKIDDRLQHPHGLAKLSLHQQRPAVVEERRHGVHGFEHLENIRHRVGDGRRRGRVQGPLCLQDAVGFLFLRAVDEASPLQQVQQHA